MPGLKYQSSVAARDALTKSELARISKLYTQWADEIAKQAEYFSKLKSNYASTQARQLDTLKKQLESSSITVTQKSLDSIKSAMTSAVQSAVTAQSNWLRSLGFKVKGIDVAFSDVPSDVVEKLVTGSIYKGGWNLSDAIWGDNEDTLKKLYEIVAGGVAQNKGTYDIAKDLEQFVRPGAKKNWNLRDKDGRRIYPKQVDYSSQRLARTLTQHAYQQGTLQAAKDNPFITSFKWVANGSRRCDICKKRDGRVYTKGRVPLDHPNGMCIIVPVVEKSDEEITDDLAAWVRGEKVDPEVDKFAKKFGYSGEAPSEKALEVIDAGKSKSKKAKATKDDDKKKDASDTQKPSAKSKEDAIKDTSKDEKKALKDTEKAAKKDVKKDVEKDAKKAVDKVDEKADEKLEPPKVEKKRENRREITEDEDYYKSLVEKFKADTHWKVEQQFIDKKLEEENRLLWHLTRDNVEAIQRYTGSEFYEINDFLRGGTSGAKELSKSMKKKVLDLVEALKQEKLLTKEDMVVRRGTSTGELAGLFMDGDFKINEDSLRHKTSEELNEMFKGQVGTYTGFTSTSSIYDRAFDGYVDVIIEVPKGASGMSIMSLSKYKTEQGEFLLNAGTKVVCKKIESVDYGDRSLAEHRVFLEVIVD